MIRASGTASRQARGRTPCTAPSSPEAYIRFRSYRDSPAPPPAPMPGPRTSSLSSPPTSRPTPPAHVRRGPQPSRSHDWPLRTILYRFAHDQGERRCIHDKLAATQPATAPSSPKAHIRLHSQQDRPSALTPRASSPSSPTASRPTPLTCDATRTSLRPQGRLPRTTLPRPTS